MYSTDVNGICALRRLEASLCGTRGLAHAQSPAASEQSLICFTGQAGTACRLGGVPPSELPSCKDCKKPNLAARERCFRLLSQKLGDLLFLFGLARLVTSLQGVHVTYVAAGEALKGCPQPTA